MAKAHALHISLLGEVQITQDGSPLKGLRSPKLQSLLAYLIVNIGVLIPRERLAYEMWPDSSESHARGSLRKAIFQLKKQLPFAEQLLNLSRQDLSWRVDAPANVDVLQLESYLGRPVSTQCLTDLLKLYKGDFLKSFYEEWVDVHQRRLRHAVEDYLRQGMTQLIGQRNWDLAKQVALQLVDMDPLREQSYQQLMIVHQNLAEPSAALGTYERCKQILFTELGIHPSQTLHNLQKRIKLGINAQANLPSSQFTSAQVQSEDLQDLLESARNHCTKNQLKEAQACLEKSEPLSTQQQPSLRIPFLEIRADLHKRLTQFGRLQRDLAELADLVLTLGDDQKLLALKNRQAFATYHGGDLRGAALIAHTAMELAQEIEDTEQHAQALRVYAIAEARLTHNYQETLDTLRRAAQLARQGKHYELISDILSDSAPIHHLMGQPDQALLASNEALALAVQHALPWQEARACFRLARYNLRECQYDAGALYIKRARDICPPHQSAHLNLYLQQAEVSHAWAMGAFSHTLTLAKSTSEAACRIGDRELEYESLREYAFVLNSLGQSEDAWAIGLQALKIARGRNISASVADMCTYMTEFAVNMAQMDSARIYLAKAERYLPLVGDHRELQGRIHMVQGLVAMTESHFEPVEALLTKAEDCFQDSRYLEAFWRCRVVRARLYLSNNKAQQALDVINELCTQQNISPLALSRGFELYWLKHLTLAALAQDSHNELQEAKKRLQEVASHLTPGQKSNFLNQALSARILKATE